MIITDNHDKICALFGDMGHMSLETKEELAKEMKSESIIAKSVHYFLKKFISKTYLKLDTNDLKNDSISYELDFSYGDEELFYYNPKTSEARIEVY